MHAIFFQIIFFLFFFDSIVFACVRPFYAQTKPKLFFITKIKVEKSTSPPPNFKGCSPYKSPEPEQQQQQSHGIQEYVSTGHSSLNNTSTNVPSPNLINNNFNLSSNKSDDLILNTNNQSTVNNIKQSTRNNRRIGRHESRYTSGKNLSKINVDFRKKIIKKNVIFHPSLSLRC